MTALGRHGWGRTVVPLALLLLSALVFTRCAIRRFSTESAVRVPVRAPVAGLGAPGLRLETPGPGTRRLLLDARAVHHLRSSADRGTEPYRNVAARADAALHGSVESGYQGFEWADAVAGLGLMWNVTGEERYAAGGIRYLRALLDDRYVVGDGKGGEDVVTHDSGYGIRTFGAYTALGYDWLRDAPGMNADLRAHAILRLGQWLTWYGRAGYLRENPTANYYWGYLTALGFAGLAASGESKEADGWLRLARDELSARVLPAFQGDLQGGGWPEGAQYGDYTTVEIALLARAFRTGADIDVAGKMPWLGQTVTYHTHALLPDEASVYDGGTWGEHPAKPSAAALSAVSFALEGVDEPRSAEARWMVEHALPALPRERAWVRLLSDREGASARSPREGAKSSYRAEGLGLTFVRSDWSRSAVWASFQAGPRLAEDHQDADQGHFELFRGSDGLLVDGGDSEGSATINHNTLLVDDGGRVLNYPPNQGVWGTKVRTIRFGDDGVAVVAVGDIGEAYAPSCARDGCTKRSVQTLVRTFVYVRPSLLVIDDDILLERPDTDVVWAAHTTTAPTLSPGLASAVVGRSRVDVRTLSPRAAESTARREPTPSGEGSHRANRPWGPMWRIEVPGPRGETKRRFLHFITADRAEAAPAPARAVEGEGLRGGLVRIDGRAVAVLFAEPGGEGRIALGTAADVLLVAGLEPGTRYRVLLDPGESCAITLSRSSDGAATVASPGGYLRVTATRCGGGTR